MKSRRRISTHVKALTFLGALPQNYCRQLHTSQIYRYKQLHPESYFGYELGQAVNNELEFIRTLNELKAAKRCCRCVLRVFVFFRNAVKNLKGFNAALRIEKCFVANLAKQFKEVLAVPTFAKLIGIHPATLQGWMHQRKFSCADSALRLCRKAHPNQLTAPEVKKMRRLLLNPDFTNWPLASVFFYALKHRVVSMSKSTWYKYATLLAITRQKPVSIKIRRQGIRAAAPNALWHADVTYFFTPGRVKLYVYSVIDNFSRFPLCVLVSDKLCGRTRVASFRQAVKTALDLRPGLQMVQLMTDGGSENFNSAVSGFLAKPDTVELRHIKALSEGWPSNSMAEAFNHVLKCFYLNHLCIDNQTALTKAVAAAVEDYAYRRPHAQLNGLTPFQAFTGPPEQMPCYTQQLQTARKQRIAANLIHSCSQKCPS